MWLEIIVTTSYSTIFKTQVVCWYSPLFINTATHRHAVYVDYISNKPSFRLKHLGVPNGSDGSDGTSYHLTENYKLPIAQATGGIAYSPPILCAWYTHHQNDMCVTLFTAAAVIL
jgi:hypothetical protein